MQVTLRKMQLTSAEIQLTRHKLQLTRKLLIFAANELYNKSTKFNKGE